MFETYNNQIQLAQKILAGGQKTWFLDTETTGFSRFDQIVEVGVIDAFGTRIFHTYCMPTAPFRSEASEANGLSVAVISQKSHIPILELSQSLKALFDELQPERLVIHNAKFDLRMLDQCGFVVPDYVDIICSMGMSKILTPTQVALNGPHDTLGDCQMLLDRIRSFSVLPPMADTSRQDFSDLSDLLMDLRVIDAEQSILKEQQSRLKAERETLEARISQAMVDGQLTKTGAAGVTVERVGVYSKVRPATGYTLDYIADKYPVLVETEPKIKSSAGRSIPKIVRENGGELPECLRAEVSEKLKVTVKES